MVYYLHHEFGVRPTRGRQRLVADGVDVLDGVVPGEEIDDDEAED